jgi:hypothetical protein
MTRFSLGSPARKQFKYHSITIKTLKNVNSCPNGKQLKKDYPNFKTWDSLPKKIIITNFHKLPLPWINEKNSPKYYKPST